MDAQLRNHSVSAPKQDSKDTEKKMNTMFWGASTKGERRFDCTIHTLLPVGIGEQVAVESGNSAHECDRS